MAKLKSCPFCGKKPWDPHLKRWKDGPSSVSWSAYVYCPDCKMTIETHNFGYKTKDEAIAAIADRWNRRAERTCTYRPSIMHTYEDDDGEEHETDEGSPFEDDGACYCSECGQPMLAGDIGWFDEKEGEHGGIIYRPRFSFCPYCGAKVVS